MPVYINNYVHSLDAQNRVSLPKEWRSEKPVEYYLWPSADKSILVLPEPLFEEQVLARIRQRLNIGDRTLMTAMNRFGGRSAKTRPDRQGRMTLDRGLTKHAGLDDKALLVGGFLTFSIRHPDSWQDEPVEEELLCLEDLLGPALVRGTEDQR